MIIKKDGPTNFLLSFLRFYTDRLILFYLLYTCSFKKFLKLQMKILKLLKT